MAGGQAGFAVTSGYDEATGLGSLDVQKFVDSYAGTKTTPTLSIDTVPAPTTITTAEMVILGVAVNGLNTIYPTGTVTISCGSYTSAVVLANGIAQLFIPAGALPVGASTLSASYTPDANGANSYNPATGSIPITVTKVPIITPSVFVGPGTLSASPAQSLFVFISVSGGAANTPPTGTVTLTSGTYTSAAAGIAGDESQITIPAQALAPGTDTLTVTYTPDMAVSSIYSSATGSATVTVTSGPKITPTVGAVPSTTGVTTAQILPVLVDVSLDQGYGYQTATGTVILGSGSYSSAAATLTGGLVTINVPAGVLAVGSDTLTANYTPDLGSSAIYTSASGTASVTVTQAPPPSFALGSASVTLYPGVTTGNAASISVAPAGGFTGSVALSAAITSSPSGAQDPPTLSFGSSSPVSITGSSAGTALLTITTTAATSGALQTPGRPWLAAGGTVLAGLLLFCAPRRRRNWRAMLGMLALLAASTGSVLACSSVQGGGGGGNGNNIPGTTAGTYTVTVTGVSGTETQTGTVTVTVE